MKNVRKSWIGLIGLLFILVTGCASLPALLEDDAPVPIVRVVETVDQQSIVEEVLAQIEQTAAEAALVESDSAEIIPPTSDAVVETAAPVVQSNTNGLVDVALEDRLVNLYDQANPSVVLLLVGSGIEGGSGSGFVYDDQGHIVTNNHVVADFSDVTAVFADGSRRNAVVVGKDADADLAVVRVDSLPSMVRPLPLSTIDEVDVGQFVIALGSPFREQGSMSLGIVSGLGRSLRSIRALENGGSYQLPAVIQTDAPINPGNSGGPLVNLDGEVVGVNSAIRTTTGTNSGVGFAIPVNAVSIMVPELIANGRYTYPLMGTSFADEDSKARILLQLGIEENIGAYVSGVSPSGPAEQAGLRGGGASGGGDIIIRLDGRDIYSFGDLNAYLIFNKRPGETMEIVVLRDGEEVPLTITLGERQ
ncbi:MAG: S1C family serine protease [Candidatus Promineifilaceae bacterium]